jgi:REP element-mobilizing transposase RayT
MYGTWTQGDDRGWVKDAKVLEGNKKLAKLNQEKLKNAPLRLKHKEKEIVRNCILKQAQKKGEKIRALAVFSNHVHVVIESGCDDIGSVARKYKAGATMALRKAGFAYDRKIWSRGFDKRYCFDRKELSARIRYVMEHDK